MVSGFSTFTATLALGVVTLGGCSPDAASRGPTAPAGPAIAVASVPAGLVTLEWQEQARSLAAANRYSPLAAGRLYAAVSVAQHRAIEAVDGTPALAGLGTGASAGGRRQMEARRGAVAGASARVLSFFFSSAATALEQRLAEQGDASAGNVHPHFARGVDAGREIGDSMVKRLQGDKFTVSWTPPAPTGAGLFTPVSLPPAGATLGGVTPYYMMSGSQFRPAPPPLWGSAAFDAAIAEVVALTQGRTPEQLAMARGWDLPAGTPTPVGYWNTVAAGLVAERGLDERAATEVFAVMQAAIMDALISCWDAKYHYWTIRPSQASSAVQLGLGLPNHPSYPSGHSCVSASAGSVLGHFFPDRQADLDARVAEAGFSRVVTGIHYWFDVTAGQEIGRQVAALAIEEGAP